MGLLVLRFQRGLALPTRTFNMRPLPPGPPDRPVRLAHLSAHTSGVQQAPVAPDDCERVERYGGGASVSATLPGGFDVCDLARWVRDSLPGVRVILIPDRIGDNARVGDLRDHSSTQPH